MTQKSPLKVYFRPIPHSQPNIYSISHCPSSVLITPHQTPISSHPLQRQENERPKLYRSFEKHKKLPCEQQIDKRTDCTLNNFKSTLSRVQEISSGYQKDRAKGKLFNLKEHITHSTLDPASHFNKTKPDRKVPSFLNRSQEKVQTKLDSIPPRSKALTYDSQTQAQTTPQQVFAVNKRVMIRFKGKTQFFKILKFLDEGSYGKVFLVQHSRTNLIYCLKCIDKKQLNDSDLNQMVREIIIQSFLSHPNIINLYGFSSDQEHIFLLLQPCLDGNLYSLIKKTPLEQKSARKVMKEVCNAVEYLHKNDIIHRDIKPENILLHEGSAKLCDFGWAVHSPLLRNTKCGTPIYTCPEMIKDESYDNKIDIWCIGVLTYEILMAMIPFEIKTPKDFCKIVEDDVLFSTTVRISQNAKDFINRCLQKQAEKRMTIRQVIQHCFLKSKDKGASHQ